MSGNLSILLEYYKFIRREPSRTEISAIFVFKNLTYDVMFLDFSVGNESLATQFRYGWICSSGFAVRPKYSGKTSSYCTAATSDGSPVGLGPPLAKSSKSKDKVLTASNKRKLTSYRSSAKSKFSGERKSRTTDLRFSRK